jgi:hypothetical protein
LQKSALHKDATEQYKQLIRQAKANGFFLSQEQCVQEILQQEGSLNSKAQQPGVNVNPGIPCCWSKVMQPQSNFQNKQPLLQMIIEDVGHICLFLPKFYCELNPIKLF